MYSKQHHISGQNNKHNHVSHGNYNHGNHMGNFMIDSAQYGKQQFGNLYQYPGMLSLQGLGGGDLYGQTGDDFGIMARSQPLVLHVETFPLMAGQYEAGRQQPFRGQNEQQIQQDQLVMRQLEELSLSSAAMGYNSNPQTPTL